VIETRLTQQYEAYRAAIDALPRLLPDLDLQSFVSESKLAFEHFELFTDNSTVNTPFYPAGVKLVTKTIKKIAYQYEYVLDGDLASAASMYEDELAEIQTHLTAIANVWDAAADALERALNDDGTLTLVLLSGSVVGIMALVVLFIRRRQSI
jgi:hypothetical protein